MVLKAASSASLRGITWETLKLLSVALLLGPGILVNSFLKPLFGRPRPIETIIFGGNAPYVPVWTPSSLCLDNCSFVSGEASFGMFMFAFAVVAQRSHRVTIAILAGVFCLAISINRIAFGAHFLSDVVLAWLSTALVLLFVHRWFQIRHDPLL
jgi:membrane-associated phospholipid phosphatase